MIKGFAIFTGFIWWFCDRFRAPGTCAGMMVSSPAQPRRDKAFLGITLEKCRIPVEERDRGFYKSNKKNG
jgi:hypothetical protein